MIHKYSNLTDLIEIDSRHESHDYLQRNSLYHRRVSFIMLLMLRLQLEQNFELLRNKSIYYEI